MNRNVVIGVAGVIALMGAIQAKELDRVVFLEAHPDDLASEMGTAVLMKGIYEMHVIDYTHGEWGCGEEKATNGWTKAKRTQEESDVCKALVPGGRTPACCPQASVAAARLAFDK